ncbi:MAG: type IV pilin protein [Bdellovibrionales bacterium]
MKFAIDQKGFTVVELMVVTAVVGVLSVIAMSSYEDLQANAKRSEAKSSLSALYIAQKSFNSEFGGYSGNLRAVGFSPTGDVLYNIGFASAHCDSWADCAPGFAVASEMASPPLPANDPAAINLTGICAAPTATDAEMRASGGCRRRSTGGVSMGLGGVAVSLGTGFITTFGAGTNVTTQTFTAAAVGQIHKSSPRNDRWVISQDKVLRLMTNGIPD